VTPPAAARIGFHAAHEQRPPSRLLQHLRRAEPAGFAAAMGSDHFHPWSERQGQSGFSWARLGAALEALPMGVVCAPAPRYHPAKRRPGRHDAHRDVPGPLLDGGRQRRGAGRGITGAPWPVKPERNARLREAVDVIRALWAGASVTHRGQVTVRAARLYTRPAVPPPLLGAALTPETAEWVGGRADG
jgi:alkanesulfonate monooxygenase SsuD/methylene tetrahydromethanopterin reductase-like flavin-dependent oxidoreductase (luciferase family)